MRHPSNVLFDGEYVYIAEFLTNQVTRIRYRQAVAGAGAPPPQRELFASGRYCAAGQGCARLDGPWGMATRSGRLFVASFGTDQVLVFPPFPFVPLSLT